MMCLIQGDVGSGKTAVAAVAMAIIARGDHQSALLAPTDLLARQHAASLARFATPAGIEHDDVAIAAQLPAFARFRKPARFKAHHRRDRERIVYFK